MAIDIDGVSKHYGAFTAVHNLSLHIPSAQVVALIGHNGAGKTSLLKMILGVSKPNSGQIRLWGDPVEHGHKFRCDLVGFLPEIANFNDAMTGMETLRFLARLKRQPLDQCATLLEQVGLLEASGKKIKTYSKGMRQRLGLAQALLGNPQLLILDEPTTGMDPDLRRDFYSTIRERRKQGATVIISTHALREIEIEADRVAILKKGELVAQGPVATLCTGIGIKTRIEVEVQPGAANEFIRKFAQQFSASFVSDSTVELTCHRAEKLSLLQKLLTADPDIRDVRVHAPRLDDVYQFYMQAADNG